MPIEEYHRALMPGLAYFKIDTLCPAYSWVQKTTRVQVWLKREGARDYRYHVRPLPEDFLKFDIPERFFVTIVPWMREISEHRSRLIEQFDRQRIERLERKAKPQ
jgi:hypothetical protein